MTENRFYNYDDALKGMVEHLTLVPTGEVRNLPMLVIYGGKPVESYRPNKFSDVYKFMEKYATVTEAERRLELVQGRFDMHFYPVERAGDLHATVVIDSITRAGAASRFHLIQDTFVRLASARGLGAGKVFIFAVEVSV